MLAGISGAIYARRAAERVDHQPRVVGEAVVTVAVANPPRLDQGIPFESVGRLRNFIVTADLGQGYDFKPVGNDPAGFFKFMLIVCCENESLDAVHTVS